MNDSSVRALLLAGTPLLPKAGGHDYSPQPNNEFIVLFEHFLTAVSEFARSPNAKTILFPVEATQLIGTLGGIGELAKEALGGAQPARPLPKKAPPPAPPGTGA